MSRIRHYETMFIVKPTLSDEETVAQIELVKTNIEKNGGESVACDDICSRPLAYEIDKHKRGHYYIAYFKAPTEAILELERNYRINENIIRFIFIKYENNREMGAYNNMCEVALKKAAK